MRDGLLIEGPRLYKGEFIVRECGYLNGENDFKIVNGSKDVTLSGDWKMNIGQMPFLM
jgi:hypothetical protein